MLRSTSPTTRRTFWPWLLAAAMMPLLAGCGGDAGPEPAQARTNLRLSEPPRATPTLFGEGVVSTDLNERDIALSPDGRTIFFTIMNGNTGTIVEVAAEGSGAPEIAAFSGKYSDLEPFFAPDGQRLYFVSNRPPAGDSTSVDYDIWYLDRTADGWSEPVNLGAPVNTEGNEFYPSVSSRGALVFTARKADSAGGEDLYIAQPDGAGGFLEPQNLGDAVNTAFDEFNALLSPDEQALIFSSYGRPDDLGGGDLYISRKNDAGDWLPAVNLGAPINSEALDFCPALSPDGHAFFFTSRRGIGDPQPASYETMARRLRGPGNGQGDVYRVAVAALDAAGN
ncbi:MAG: hypothetical protein R2834_02025 [Rhodothermales bacterium]